MGCPQEQTALCLVPPGQPRQQGSSQDHSHMGLRGALAQHGGGGNMRCSHPGEQMSRKMVPSTTVPLARQKSSCATLLSIRLACKLASACDRSGSPSARKPSSNMYGNHAPGWRHTGNAGPCAVASSDSGPAGCSPSNQHLPEPAQNRPQPSSTGHPELVLGRWMHSCIGKLHWQATCGSLYAGSERSHWAARESSGNR